MFTYKSCLPSQAKQESTMRFYGVSSWSISLAKSSLDLCYSQEVWHWAVGKRNPGRAFGSTQHGKLTDPSSTSKSECSEEGSPLFARDPAGPVTKP
jgi:hypothetical protein